jgi:hypothetical protein
MVGTGLWQQAQQATSTEAINCMLAHRPSTPIFRTTIFRQRTATAR